MLGNLVGPAARTLFIGEVDERSRPARRKGRMPAEERRVRNATNALRTKSHKRSMAANEFYQVFGSPDSSLCVLAGSLVRLAEPSFSSSTPLAVREQLREAARPSRNRLRCAGRLALMLMHAAGVPLHGAMFSQPLYPLFELNPLSFLHSMEPIPFSIGLTDIRQAGIFSLPPDVTVQDAPEITISQRMVLMRNFLSVRMHWETAEPGRTGRHPNFHVDLRNILRDHLDVVQSAIAFSLHIYLNCPLLRNGHPYIYPTASAAISFINEVIVIRPTPIRMRNGSRRMQQSHHGGAQRLLPEDSDSLSESDDSENEHRRTG